ncbi:olfactory receptor 14J1-like [Opisthocomus hoazin]|uniref:olfactory receptor 14J1-like n=1 Tax=Opisthocomus hoazin TaxID=30419 RepID=UPI003F52C26F
MKQGSGRHGLPWYEPTATWRVDRAKLSTLHNVTARLEVALETPNSLFPTKPSMSLFLTTHSARRDAGGYAGLYFIGQLRVEWSSEGIFSQREQMPNGSSITEFVLLEFADKRELQLLHFWFFLAIYLATLLSNGLIITVIACDHRLHTPMYFFLLNLSLLDLGSISTTVLKSMTNSLWNTRAISFTGCAAQLFLFSFLVVAECCLLTVMAYDRYVAICKPLHYETLLGSRACVHMAAAAWGSGFLNALLHTANTFSIPLCKGNAVDQFFCEIPQILKLSCSHSYLREGGLLVVSVSLVFGCFVLIVLSYVQIFRAVLRIPSEQGRHKAFSTCLPHLAVVSLFIGTLLFAYLKSPSISFPLLDLVVAVLYTVVPPAVNPLIYSMRNQELKDAVQKLVTGCS